MTNEDHTADVQVSNWTLARERSRERVRVLADYQEHCSACGARSHVDRRMRATRACLTARARHRSTSVEPDAENRSNGSCRGRRPNSTRSSTMTLEGNRATSTMSNSPAARARRLDGRCRNAHPCRGVAVRSELDILNFPTAPRCTRRPTMPAPVPSVGRSSSVRLRDSLDRSRAAAGRIAGPPWHGCGRAGARSAETPPFA